MRIVWLLVGIVVVLLGAAFWQHQHYVDVRRAAAHDKQDIFHGNVFHVVTLTSLTANEDPLTAAQAFYRAADAPAVRWVYAGQVVFNGQASRQLGNVNWSLAFLTQYASREAYISHSSSPQYQMALAAFDQHYEHGARRSMLQNLLTPQMFLPQRISGLVNPPAPFRRKAELPQQVVDAEARLRSHADTGAEAAVVFNLQQRGTAEQRAADARYVAPMVQRMAKLGYGPLHMAETVAVPGSADFDGVAIVFYPGVDYFADMITSEFYQSIFADKQLGDNVSSVTVPILHRL